jgi:hypothetical protein
MPTVSLLSSHRPPLNDNRPVAGKAGGENSQFLFSHGGAIYQGSVDDQHGANTRPPPALVQESSGAAPRHWCRLMTASLLWCSANWHLLQCADCRLHRHTEPRLDWNTGWILDRGRVSRLAGRLGGNQPPRSSHVTPLTSDFHPRGP